MGSSEGPISRLTRGGPKKVLRMSSSSRANFARAEEADPKGDGRCSNVIDGSGRHCSVAEASSCKGFSVSWIS